MAPGNLNLKKSWHPGLLKNQKKVWEAEQEALDERKKIQERQDEIAKEKELAELRALQFAKTGKKALDRVDWMYESPGAGDGGRMAMPENEDYLLGNKRVDDLIVNKKVEVKKQGFEKLEQQPTFMTQHQELAMSRDDPMVKIREQQMRKLQQMKQQRSRVDDRTNRSGPSRDDSTQRSHRNYRDESISSHRDREHKRRGDSSRSRRPGDSDHRDTSRRGLESREYRLNRDRDDGHRPYDDTDRDRDRPYRHRDHHFRAERSDGQKRHEHGGESRLQRQN